MSDNHDELSDRLQSLLSEYSKCIEERDALKVQANVLRQEKDSACAERDAAIREIGPTHRRVVELEADRDEWREIAEANSGDFVAMKAERDALKQEIETEYKRCGCEVDPNSETGEPYAWCLYHRALMAEREALKASHNRACAAAIAASLPTGHADTPEDLMREVLATVDEIRAERDAAREALSLHLDALGEAVTERDAALRTGKRR